MKKKKLTRAARVFAFCLSTILLFCALSDGMISLEITSTSSIKGLYHQKEDSLDALVIGASEVYTSYAPTIAWEKYGYTSYSLACPSAPGNVYKYFLAEALKTQKPKVVAFEINGFLVNDDYFKSESRLRKSVDNLKWSKNKVDMINNLIPKESRRSYFFPLEAYHDEWRHPARITSNLGVRFFMALHGANYTKGYGSRSTILKQKKRSRDGKFCFTKLGESYLRDLLEYCKGQGLENVVFYRAPHARYKKNRESLDKVFEIVESYGYQTIDYDRDLSELGISLKKDFYDKEHLNAYGVEKFTTIFGEYLSTQFDLKSEHTQAVVDDWNLSAKKTNAMLEECRADIDSGVERQYSELNIYYNPDMTVDEEQMD